MCFLTLIISILLSAKVCDFSSAENLAIEWLSDASNQTLTQYSSILELLITHVLLPQTKLQEAQALVELNSGLSPEKKMHFLKYLEKVEEEWRAREKTDTERGSARGEKCVAFQLMRIHCLLLFLGFYMYGVLCFGAGQNVVVVLLTL